MGLAFCWLALPALTLWLAFLFLLRGITAADPLICKLCRVGGQPFPWPAMIFCLGFVHWCFDGCTVVETRDIDGYERGND